MRIAGIIFLTALTFGCDVPDRVGRLEKENKELRSEIEKVKASKDYDMQEKCSRDGMEWLRDNWSRDKNTIFMSYHMHYNKTNNSCFMVIEDHSKSTFGEDGSWSNVVELWDVLENNKYASMQVDHLLHSKPEYKIGDDVVTCEVAGDKCKTADEFYNATHPYMSN